MKKLFKESVQIIRDNWKPYLWTNIIYYGAVVIGLLYAWLNPGLHIKVLNSVLESLRTGSLSSVNEVYYIHRNIPLAILYTFLGNLLKSTLLFISIPSLIFPFFGFLSSFFAFYWGLVLGIESIMNYPPIVGLIILEGQGYVIAIFSTYLHALQVMNPKKFNIHSRSAAYLNGLKMIGKLYVLIVIVLIVAACYEVFITSNMQPFPNFSYTKEQLGFSGTNVKLKYSGSYVFYDSLTIMESEAKVVGILLEDIMYLKPGDPNSIRLYKTDSCYEIQFYLEDKYWNINKIDHRFRYVKNQLNKLYSTKCYKLKAFYFNLSGIRKEKYFAE